MGGSGEWVCFADDFECNILLPIFFFSVGAPTPTPPHLPPLSMTKSCWPNAVYCLYNANNKQRFPALISLGYFPLLPCARMTRLRILNSNRISRSLAVTEHCLSPQTHRRSLSAIFNDRNGRVWQTVCSHSSGPCHVWLIPLIQSAYPTQSVSPCQSLLWLILFSSGVQSQSITENLKCENEYKHLSEHLIILVFLDCCFPQFN